MHHRRIRCASSSGKFAEVCVVNGTLKAVVRLKVLRFVIEASPASRESKDLNKIAERRELRYGSGRMHRRKA